MLSATKKLKSQKDVKVKEREREVEYHEAKTPMIFNFFKRNPHGKEKNVKTIQNPS